MKNLASNEKVIFKNCLSFSNCISKVNNTLVDDADDIDVVMLMYNLIEYRDNYLRTSEILWLYCREKPALGDTNSITYFTVAKCITDWFRIKEKMRNRCNRRQ